MLRKAKEAERVTEPLCCFECYFDHESTDRYGESKIVLITSASQHDEMSKLAKIKNNDHVTLYASFVIAHDAV